jgi:nitrilase
MRVVKAAAVQLSPVLYSREGTVEKIVRTIHELGQQRVQFATFPETVIPYYPYFSFVQSPLQNIVGAEQRKLLDQAVTVPSAATDALGAAARQAGVVVSIGINERDGGTVYNTQLLFDADGTLIQRRRSTPIVRLDGEFACSLRKPVSTQGRHGARREVRESAQVRCELIDRGYDSRYEGA